MSRATWLVGVAFVAAIIAAYVARRYLAKATASNRGLRVAPEKLKFGEVWESETFAWSLPITNPNPHPLSISGFAFSCTCATVAPQSLTILPNETVELALLFDLRSETQELVRDFSAKIVPQFPTGMVYQDGWTISGRVRRALTLSQKTLNFGDSLVRGQKQGAKAIQAKAAVSLKELRAQYPEEVVSVTIAASRENQTEFDVVVAPNASLPPGSFQIEVTLTPVPENGDALPAVKFPVAGQVSDYARLVPARLLLGTRLVGDVAEETVIVESMSGEPLQLVKIEGTSPGTELTAAPSEAAGALTLRLRQVIVKEGPASEMVHVLVQANGRDVVKLPVQVLYHGLARRGP
jgi:hypothetical protein